MPLTIYDGNGNYVWDTDSVAGGVIAATLSFAPTTTGTWSYPAFAGRQAFIVNTIGLPSEGDTGVDLNMDAGYPRVIVRAANRDRSILLLIR